MDELLRTAPGDVLILRTTHTYTIHAVGRVSTPGQEDFATPTRVKYAVDLKTALTAAKALLAPGHRIFLHDIDTDVWREISD